jgi:ElaB/YqjD/DUF883 family membrane-anchored ribosome-binding protein
MPDVDNPPGEPSDVQAQLAQLRAQVEALMQDRAAPAGEDAATHTETDGCGCCKAVRQHAEEFSRRIRGQPLLAVLIATGAGFVLGRTLR